jgi:O6-methylguanine-DNA--protein-cysteine methyltransferase
MIEQIALGAVESPIGVVWMACSERGVCKLVFPEEGAKAALAHWLARDLPGMELTSVSAILAQTFRELREYFNGTRRDFTVPLDLRGSAFQRRVWQTLARIPYGQTASYGSIARQLNQPQAARAVGAACGANPVPIIVP